MVRGLGGRVAVALSCAALMVAINGCASIQEGTKDNPKAVLGSVLGAGAGGGIAAIAGANPALIVASAVAGGLIGGYVGHKLDDKDKQMATEAAHRAFEQSQTGQHVEWKNPDSGNSGTVTPTRTYQLANGQYCRQYQQTIVIGGEDHESFGTACRKTDGSWEITS